MKQKARGTCFMWVPDLIKEWTEKSWSHGLFTTWNVASIYQVLALARSCSWWGVYRRRCLWPDTYTSLYWSSGMWLSKNSVANWKVSGISIIFRIQCICNLIITFCLNSWIIKFYTSKFKSFGSFGLMFCLTLWAVLVRFVGFGLLAEGASASANFCRAFSTIWGAEWVRRWLLNSPWPTIQNIMVWILSRFTNYYIYVL